MNGKPQPKKNKTEEVNQIELSDQDLSMIGQAFDSAIKSSQNSQATAQALFPIGTKLGVYQPPQTTSS